MQIDTGTTNERLARSGIMTLALCVFAVWFALDGWYRYPRKALASFQTFLKLDEPPTPHPKLTYGDAETAKREYPKGMNKADVLARLGEPIRIRQSPAAQFDDWHYVGQFGRLALEVQRTDDPNDGKVVTVAWEPAPSDYDHDAIRQQKFFAVACAIAGAIGLVWLVRVWRTRVVVDDAGLTYDGLAIPWEAMTELDSSKYHAKAWLTLSYTSGQSERRIRLDSFKIDAFDDVIDAICRQKGFANPIPIDDLDDDHPPDADDQPTESTDRASPPENEAT